MLKRTLVRMIEVLIIVILVLVSGAWVYFRYYKETTFRTNAPLSAEVSAKINAMMDKSSIINGVQVVKVDLKRNIRYIIYFDWKTPEIKDLYEQFSKTRITSEIPVFTEDELQNMRMVRLMNHEYDCTPFKDTLSYKLVPEATNYISTICSISIPPAFGEFKGIVALSLNKIPNNDEKEIIRRILIDMSSEIYKEIK